MKRPNSHVVVVGGGISGLATAYFLRRASEGAPPDVTLVEATGRLGGKVLTTEVAGVSVDVGPDCIPMRPAVRSLFDELGLTDAVVPAASLGVYVWSRGRLRRVPPGTFLGVPDRLLPLVRSRLLSATGTVRAGFDLVRPRGFVPDDASVAQLLRPRFGTELLERLVEPMLGGIHAGGADTISARSAVPEIDALVRSNRSVILALQRRRRSAARAARAARAGTGPSLVTLDGGLAQLIDAMVDELAGVDVLVDAPVTGLRQEGSGFRVEVGGRSAVSQLDADAVVFATPAFVTANLIDALAPDVAVQLRGISYADAATVTLAYSAASVGSPLDATGFLVPRCENRLLVGCTWLNAKWPHLGDQTVTIFRAFVGGSNDRRAMSMDDATLVQRVHEELAEAIGLRARPEHVVVQRWPRALPEYSVGHELRIERIFAGLGRFPGLYLTGAAYRGAGTAACLAHAAQTAAQVREALPVPEVDRSA